MDKKYIKNLNREEKEILFNKGTEDPHTGIYNDFYDTGIYVCKACKKGLYFSNFKFKSGCGWPSFDDEISDSIIRKKDFSHGIRTEILCSKCEGHLGHVFKGENYTTKNIRHCVNSISMSFVSINKKNIKEIDSILEKHDIPKNELLLFLEKIG